MAFRPKLLITGASGFIGQALVDALHQDYMIFGVYETFEKMQDKNPQIRRERKYMIDMRDAPLLEQVVGIIQPEYVIHLAARSEVANSFDNYLEVADINYRGTVALAEANRKYNPRLRNFIFASTMETYGKQEWQRPFTEETTQNPMAPYAVAKVAAEKYLQYMNTAYSFPMTILRQSNTYGRYDNNFFVVEQIISQFYTDFDYIHLGDPYPMRNFLYISDLVELYRTILRTDEYKTFGQVFVTGPENAVTIRELAQMIAVKFGFDPLTADDLFKWYTRPQRPGEIYYLNSTPKKALDILGWKPQVTLSQGLDLTIQKMKIQDTRQER